MRPYTFSRAMCWAGIDRGAMIAGLLGRPDLADRWAAIARTEQEIVLRRGYNTELGMFTQVLDGLESGEHVVTIGSFFIDAEHKLKGA